MTARTNADSSLVEGELTDRIIGAFFHVYDALGFGFLESVYRRALAIQLARRGVRVECEVATEVWYGSDLVGLFKADLIVDRKVVVELKASERLLDADRKQLMNYLRATSIEVGLLLHFGPKAGFQRVVYSNRSKPVRHRDP